MSSAVWVIGSVAMLIVVLDWSIARVACGGREGGRGGGRREGGRGGGEEGGREGGRGGGEEVELE